MFYTVHSYTRLYLLTLSQSYKNLIALGPSNPKNTLIDARLLIGSALFGMGWGLAGVCPGPAIVAAGSGAAFASPFLPAMLLSMLAYDVSLGDGQSHLTHLAISPLFD